jgi:hypothetical protein
MQVGNITNGIKIETTNSFSFLSKRKNNQFSRHFEKCLIL